MYREQHYYPSTNCLSFRAYPRGSQKFFRERPRIVCLCVPPFMRPKNKMRKRVRYIPLLWDRTVAYGKYVNTIQCWYSTIHSITYTGTADVHSTAAAVTSIGVCVWSHQRVFFLCVEESLKDARIGFLFLYAEWVWLERQTPTHVFFGQISCRDGMPRHWNGGISMGVLSSGCYGCHGEVSFFFFYSSRESPPDVAKL